MNEADISMGNEKTEFDYIVVGGGTAGCAAAGRLVERYGARVLLLEAGISDKNPMIRIPAGCFKLVFGRGPEIHRYESVPQTYLNGRTISIPQANVLGGGSSVNAMLYLRGSPNDYNRWADLVGKEWGWDWDNMLSYFREQEGNERFHNEFHGIEGPYKVSDPRHINEGSYRFVQAMQASGLPLIDDFNGERKSGAGFCQTATYRGERWSAADAFIHNISGPQKLTLKTNARVLKIICDKKRAVGVEYTHNGKIHSSYVGEEILLAAGALRSPQLLMLSGIGPAADLRRLGIGVISNLPGVGQNLIDHPMVGISNASSSRGYFGDDKGFRMLSNGIQWALFKSGPATTIGAEAQALINVGNGSEPDIEIYHMNTLLPNLMRTAKRPGISLLALLLRPYSRGYVKLRSPDIRDNVILDPCFLADGRDMDTMVLAMDYLRDIMRTPPLSDVIQEELAPGPTVRTREQWEDYIRSAIETNYHPCGTCKMGSPDDDMAVLTPDLKVKGIAALRVIDASMMPDIPGANLNATVAAVAAKAADLTQGILSNISSEGAIERISPSKMQISPSFS